MFLIVVTVDLQSILEHIHSKAIRSVPPNDFKRGTALISRDSLPNKTNEAKSTESFEATVFRCKFLLQSPQASADATLQMFLSRRTPQVKLFRASSAHFGSHVLEAYAIVTPLSAKASKIIGTSLARVTVRLIRHRSA